MNSENFYWDWLYKRVDRTELHGHPIREGRL